MAARDEQLALLADVRSQIVRELRDVELEAIQLNTELAEVDSEIEEVEQWN